MSRHLIKCIGFLRACGLADEAAAIEARRTPGAQLAEMRESVRRLAWVLSKKGTRHDTRRKLIAALRELDTAISIVEQETP